MNLPPHVLNEFMRKEARKGNIDMVREYINDGAGDIAGIYKIACATKNVGLFKICMEQKIRPSLHMHESIHSCLDLELARIYQEYAETYESWYNERYKTVIKYHTSNTIKRFSRRHIELVRESEYASMKKDWKNLDLGDVYMTFMNRGYLEPAAGIKKGSELYKKMFQIYEFLEEYNLSEDDMKLVCCDCCWITQSTDEEEMLIRKLILNHFGV